MSALGHKRTFRKVQTMSALPPKEDITKSVVTSASCQQQTCLFIRLSHRPPRGELLALSSQDFSQFCYLGPFHTSWASVLADCLAWRRGGFDQLGWRLAGIGRHSQSRTT